VLLFGQSFILSPWQSGRYHKQRVLYPLLPEEPPFPHPRLSSLTPSKIY
jgi:hypothetical protein